MSETAAIIETTEPSTKVTEKAPNRRGLLPLIDNIKPVHLRFAQAIVANGGNAVKAYEHANLDGAKTYSGKAATAHKWTKREDVREAIRYHMSLYGADEHFVSKRVSSMLHSTDPWVADRGVTHSRAILGLDAPSESHMTVDKRSINITCTAEEAKSLMKELISKSK